MKMNVSTLPTTCLILAMVALTMAKFPSSSSSLSSTNGHETVTWSAEHGDSNGRYKRNTNSGLSIRCRISRELTSSQAMVKKSMEGFESDKRNCIIHERRRRQVMAGTKWCGNGDNANGYDDLGYFSEVDKCCREHDHCERYLVGYGTDFGITNETPYTWSDCTCDDDFRTCLHNVNTYMSSFVGSLFYNIVPYSKCLKFDENDPSKVKAVSKGTYEGRNEGEEEEESDSWWNWFG